MTEVPKIGAYDIDDKYLYQIFVIQISVLVVSL